MTITGLDQGKTYFYKAVSIDGSDNSAESGTSSFTTLPDATPPSGTLSINGGATYATTTSVTLNPSCNDAGGSGCAEMSISTDNTTWSAAVSYSGSYTWTLPVGDGVKTVYVKYKDLAGNWSDPITHSISASIILDTVAPQPPADLSATASQTSAQLNWTTSVSTDVASYRLYSDNGTGTINYSSPIAVISHPASTYTVTLNKGGTYRFGLRSMDVAGNEEKNNNVTVSATVVGLAVPTATINSIAPASPTFGEIVELVGTYQPVNQSVTGSSWTMRKLTNGVPEGDATEIGNKVSFISNTLPIGTYRVYFKVSNANGD